MKNTLESQIENAIAKAWEMGTKAGKNAASWYEQDSWGGRVSNLKQSKANASEFLKRYDDGDPALYDAIELPSLSGEWAGDLTGLGLYELTMGEFAEADDQESFDDICSAWEDGVQMGFWDYLVESANSVINN
jgi:hypothetical protein